MNVSELVKKHGGPILTALGTVGLIGTVLVTAKQTMLYKDLLSDGEQKPVSRKEIVKIAAPVLAIGVGTLGCFVGASVLSENKCKSFMASYGLLEQGFNKYRNKVVDIYGREADNYIMDAIAIHSSEFHQWNIDTPDRKVVWYDEHSGNSIERYEREIIDAEFHINRNLALGGTVSLNDYYEMFGFPKTEDGDNLFFSICDSYTFLDFYHTLINRDDGGMPIYSITTMFPPEDDEYWFNYC